MKTTNYSLRLDPAVKANAEETFRDLGLNLSEAINVFLHKAIMVHGFPFDVRNPKPRENLLEAMRETEQILAEYKAGTRKAKPFTSGHDLIQEILAEEDEDDV